jgi:hypothetical protein
MSGLARSIHVDIAALEQIIEPADAIPAVAIAFHQKPVPAAFVGMAVVLAQQVDQQFSGIAGNPYGESDLAVPSVSLRRCAHRSLPRCHLIPLSAFCR